MTIDEALERARRGDARAFNRLVDHVQAAAFHVAYHHLGGADDALDACQEAMLSAWRAIGGFEGDVAHFRSWVLAIVVNACRDRSRYEARRPRVRLETAVDGEWRPLPLPDPGQSPEAYAENADLAALLDRALAELSEDHRSVVLLDQIGLDYAEMAAALGIEVGTVKSRLSRARARLRDTLTGAMAAPGIATAAAPEPAREPCRSLVGREAAAAPGAAAAAPEGDRP